MGRCIIFKIYWEYWWMDCEIWEEKETKILSLIGISISYGYFDYVYTLLNKKHN